MADTGFLFPDTMTNRVTGDNWFWSNVNNAKADDGNNAQVTVVTVGDHSDGLGASNFGFATIPVGAVIDGIEVRVGDINANFVAADGLSRILLILADDSDGSEIKGPVTINPTPATHDFGGSMDLWSETITRDDIADPDFGFSIQLMGGNWTYVVDYLQMKIYYTPPVPGKQHVVVPQTQRSYRKDGRFS